MGVRRDPLRAAHGVRAVPGLQGGRDLQEHSLDELCVLRRQLQHLKGGGRPARPATRPEPAPAPRERTARDGPPLLPERQLDRAPGVDAPPRARRATAAGRGRAAAPAHRRAQRWRDAHASGFPWRARTAPPARPLRPLRGGRRRSERLGDHVTLHQRAWLVDG